MRKTIKQTRYIALVTAAFLAVATQAPAQNVLEKNRNLPRSGDILTKQQVLYKDPGRSGKDVLWDFSKLAPEEKESSKFAKKVDKKNKEMEKAILQEAGAENPLVVSYQGDTDSTFWETMQETRYHYRLSGNKLLYCGYENASIRMEFSTPEIHRTYPLAFGGKQESYFEGEGIYYGKLDVTQVGSFSFEADAYGMMILPSGDTLKNVLRVHSLRTTADEMKPNAWTSSEEKAKQKKEKEEKEKQNNGKGQDKKDAKADSIARKLKEAETLLLAETILWYAPGYRYPVFEVRRDYLDRKGKPQLMGQAAYFYHPDQQKQDYLDKDSDNLSMARQAAPHPVPARQGTPAGLDASSSKMEALYYNVFPNPVSDELHVEIHLKAKTPVQLTLYSLSGAVVYRGREEMRGPGLYEQALPVSSLERGTYLLQIRTGQETRNEKIIKQ